MLRVPILVCIALAIAFYGGVKSSLLALDHVGRLDALTVGPVGGLAGPPDLAAGPLCAGLPGPAGEVLLGEAEGLAFSAKTDSDGRRLSGRCSYAISGNTPAARLWTLRVADASGRPLAGAGSAAATRPPVA